MNVLCYLRIGVACCAVVSALAITLHRVVRRRPIQQLTVGMIKPDAIADGNAPKIFARIHEMGFTVIRCKLHRFSYTSAREFYSHLDQKYAQYFDGIYKFISSGDCLVFAMTGPDVIVRWREEMGPSWPPDARVTHPRSLRALYGCDKVGANGTHGSVSPQEVVRQLTFFEWIDLIEHCGPLGTYIDGGNDLGFDT